MGISWIYWCIGHETPKYWLDINKTKKVLHISCWNYFIIAKMSPNARSKSEGGVEERVVRQRKSSFFHFNVTCLSQIQWWIQLHQSCTTAWVPLSGKRYSVESSKEGKSWLDKIHVSMLGQRRHNLVLRAFVVSFLFKKRVVRKKKERFVLNNGWYSYQALEGISRRMKKCLIQRKNQKHRYFPNHQPYEGQS